MARDPIHPGRFLADELTELQISAAELAQALHVPPNRIYQILNGKRAMTADTALRLSQWFGTSAEFWMNLQKMYELRLAEPQLDRYSRTPYTEDDAVFTVGLMGVIISWDIRSLAKRRYHRGGEPSMSKTCVIRLRRVTWTSL